MEIIKRQQYIDKIKHYLDKDTIIVLTGQRRVGKSYMLQQLWREMESTGDNVIFIDKEKHEFDNIRNYQDLNAYIESHRKKNVINYIMIDEVQDISDFERSLRSFYSEKDVEIIVTGSNAKMLSSELATLIGGRYKEIYIQPLSYTEFLLFHHLDDNEQSLSLYIDLGGMPGLARIELDKTFAREYQNDIINTVLLKDIVARNSVRNVPFLERLVHFLADNEGKLISATTISKYMKGQGETITPSAIINYQQMMVDAYMIHRVARFNIRGKRLLENNDKYYFGDHGLRNAIVGGTREGDIEKVIENVVFQQLIRMGYDVNVGQLQAGEIDFVCQHSDGKRAYVQVAYIIASEETRQREFGNLKAIRDNYPKYVISMTPLVTRNDEEGVTHIHLHQFLTKGFDA